MENSLLRNLTEVPVKAANPYYTWRSRNKLISVEDSDRSDVVPDEGTAIEMLDALRKESPKISSNRLDIGDIIWGRVKSYPWWPGQIMDEALASPSVQSRKREGALLVAFYGDDTFAWLAPTEIIPFDINFGKYYKQTNSQAFSKGVKEAMDEIKRRVELGLSCNCHNSSNLQVMMMEEDSVKLIQKAREGFQPEGIIYFLKHLGLSPRKIVKQNPYWTKNVAKLSSYRKAVVRKFMEQHKSLEGLAGIARENEKASQGVQMIFDQVKISPSKMFPVKTSLGDASRNISSSSRGFKEQIGPNDLANASNKRRISSHLDEFGVKKKQVRMNKLEYLARFAANEVLELQGKSQRGTRSGSSTQPEKNSQPNQESVRRDVKERTLTIKFPSQTILPSVSELKAKFASFGPLDEYLTSFLKKSSTCNLVFQHKRDTEIAYRYAIQNRALFGSSGVRYYLQASDHDSNVSYSSLRLVENQTEIQLTSSLNGNKFADEPMSASLLLPEKNQLMFYLKRSPAQHSDCPSIPQSHSLENSPENSKIP